MAKSKNTRSQKWSKRVPPTQDRVVIVGKARRMQTFNLPHDVYCAALGECSCSETEVSASYVSDEDHEYHVAKMIRLVNDSLRVRFRQRVSVPKVALQCPEIAVALTKRDLRIEE